MRRDLRNFGGDADHDPDPRLMYPDLYPDPDRDIFKGFFTYYCDSYRQPRIKRENKNPRRRFELSECFLHRVLQKLSHFFDITSLSFEIFLYNF